MSQKEIPSFIVAFPRKRWKHVYRLPRQLAKDRWRKEALTFSFHRFKRKLSICYPTLGINRHQVLLTGTQLEYFNSPTYLPREGLSIEEVLRPLAVLAPEV